MLEIIIYGKPIPWTAPRLNKNRVYSIHSQLREKIIWQMKSQFKNDPLSCPLKVEMDFYFKIPEKTSSIRKMQMLANKIQRIARPDLTNLSKFLEDCGNGILWEDDAYIFESRLRKCYGQKEMSIIRIYISDKNK